MTENKRFKALPNDRDAWDIIDYEESKKINGYVIYNDLGSIYFSSAPQLVDLLNELHDECEFLEIENESLEDGATKYAELYHKSLKENEQLKKALLFFVDVANAECSSNWLEDMEKDCKRLFNCTYEEAKEKYGDYEW